MNALILLWIFISSLVGAVGNTLLKRAADVHLDKNTNLFDFSNALVVKKLILFSFSGCFYAMGFLLWGYVLSKSSLSKAYPVYVSFTFLLVIGFSILFLNEAITLKVVIGYILIGIAIYLIV